MVRTRLLGEDSAILFSPFSVVALTCSYFPLPPAQNAGSSLPFRLHWGGARPPEAVEEKRVMRGRREEGNVAATAPSPLSPLVKNQLRRVCCHWERRRGGSLVAEDVATGGCDTGATLVSPPHHAGDERGQGGEGDGEFVFEICIVIK